MTQKGFFAVMGVLLLIVVFPVLAQEENLSEGRSLGIGMQVDFPFGGLVSGRYWASPNVGVEGIVFLWGRLGELEGIVTARFLYRISDTAAVDFYTAAGASFPFSPYGEVETILSGVGGIEFSFPFARSLAWNVEFGVTFSTDGELAMAVGTGIHFYF